MGSADFTPTERPCACCGVRTAREGEGGIYSLTCARLEGGECCEKALVIEAEAEAARHNHGRDCEACGERLVRIERTEGTTGSYRRVVEWYCRRCRWVEESEWNSLKGLIYNST